jgi:superfamily II DNA/RNA helicase
MSRKFLNDNYYYVTSNTGFGLKANEKVKQTFYWIEDENSKLDKLAELLKSEITGSVISKIIFLLNLL